jgi:hypothetical protein
MRADPGRGIVLRLENAVRTAFGNCFERGPFPQPWAVTAVLMAPPSLNVFVIAWHNDTPRLTFS